jgi:hypothetical protein
MKIEHGFKPLTEIEQVAAKEQFRLLHSALKAEIALHQDMFPGPIAYGAGYIAPYVEKRPKRVSREPFGRYNANPKEYMRRYYLEVLRPKRRALQAAVDTPQAEPHPAHPNAA